MRYKILGLINLVLGLVQSGSSLVYYFIIIPKLMKMYEDFSVGTKPDPNLLHRGLFILLLLGLINLSFALANFFSPRKLFFWLGVLAAVVSLLAAVSYFRFAALSVLFPIYNLTSNF